MKSDFLTDYDISAVPGCDCDDVTAENFDERVLAREKPCVMRGLVADWPVVQAAKVSAQHLADYLISLDAGKSARTFVAPPGIGGRYFYNDDMTGFNFEQRQGPIVDIIRSLIEISDLDSPPGIYAGATSSDELFPAFARHNEMPLLGPGVRPLAWIGNASRVAPHFDTSRNIACVVAGTRRFLLFPPSQIENLYVGPIDHTMAGQPASLVDPRAIDEEKFPRFAKALSAAQMVTLEPGDAIYIPSMWWHYVEAEGSFNMLVNYWWNEGSASGRWKRSPSRSW